MEKISDEFHNLYCSPNIIRVIKSGSTRWPEHVVRMGEVSYSHESLFGKLEEKGELERPRRRLEDDIKMKHKRVWCESVD
jgi:hypothetical protein